MHGKTHRKMKPLKRCRKMFTWFCADVIYKPLNEKQVRLRKIFRFMIGVFTIASAVIANSSLAINRFSANDIDELFVRFFQFMITLIEITSVIVMIKLSPSLPSLFRNLDKIHNACENFRSFRFLMN